MHRDTLLIFARAPRLGAVKRRLARGIGAMAALRFYRAQLAAVAQTAAREGRWDVRLATTPPGARAPWPLRLPGIPQGHGDLGARLDRTTRAHPGRVVVIGSDIPGITAADIRAAFRALGRADAVFGPAEDGGYWLVGLSARRPARPFAKVRWSTEHALADTLANFVGRRIALLRTLRDVDTAEDLAALAAAPRPLAGLPRLQAGRPTGKKGRGKAKRRRGR
ncbi:TIGR04282 family arsenosugar biosynthesis glycosyltransferase [Roseomonas sp. E05]|uniref:TIGR04282 family arsenosugar biosynthesis glycosyltransferase n=1 Tax=Roseomonas sp. E05 TaxID=3046310 RepID=UPI0024BAE9FE|nr:TIGR04282 family arsenosugar biosynthesis glycosyltransferase [Roseomonas sp. E05]MDJ0389113.1 TIGR04282 family arsenosugar biosynthesis glycosyltransferase [Roseomonas sp. E05]